MKLIIIFCFIFLSLPLIGQTIDSSAIAFKAKLLTTSNFGLASKESILKDIDSQKVQFLNSSATHTLFLKVTFSQKYFKGSRDSQTVWIGPCAYYLAYSTDKYRFYRLAGFDSLDIEDFFSDLHPNDLSVLINKLDDDRLDLLCLHKLRKSKRKKSKNLCLPCCSKTLQTTLNSN